MIQDNLLNLLHLLKKLKVFLPYQRQKKQLKNVAFTIQRFLSLSDDKHELASFEYPNFDKWEWSDDMKKEAKNIWSI